MESVMGELKPQQTQVVLKGNEVLKYFPPGTTAGEDIADNHQTVGNLVQETTGETTAAGGATPSTNTHLTRNGEIRRP